MQYVSIEGILQGRPRAVSKALSLVENGDFAAVSELLQELYPKAAGAFVIGITGSPGAGKSTLVEQLAQLYVQQSHRVGILAVDPTSPFSGGAILGDRIRMQELATHPAVFIRSFATRGKLGGLSAAVDDALVVLAAAGYEILLVETVGVGQDEVDIVQTADVTAVVLVPGMGDDIQAIKAGIMEIGDLFVINKADRDGVQKTRAEVEAHLALSPRDSDWTPPVLETVASQGKGIAELESMLTRFRALARSSDWWKQRRLERQRQRIIDLLRTRILDDVVKRAGNLTLDTLAKQVGLRELDPYAAVERLYKDLSLP